MTQKPQYPFISFLEAHHEDRAMLAELRRGLGRSPGETPGMFPYVMPYLHNTWHEDDYYLIASLFALHPKAVSSGNMGKHLRDYCTAVGDDAATTRRFMQLLRQRRESLDAPLRQHIQLLKAKEIPVNWHQLMSDLHNWGHPDFFVQKHWANAYWPATKNQSKTNKE